MSMVHLKTMCTCRNISSLNISIHYLHINNSQILDKNVLHYTHKIGELIIKLDGKDNMQIIKKINTMFCIPFPLNECASCNL